MVLEVALRVVEVRTSSRNWSPAPRPLGIKAQSAATSVCACAYCGAPAKASAKTAMARQAGTGAEKRRVACPAVRKRSGTQGDVRSAPLYTNRQISSRSSGFRCSPWYRSFPLSSRIRSLRRGIMRILDGPRDTWRRPSSARAPRTVRARRASSERQAGGNTGRPAPRASDGSAVAGPRVRGTVSARFIAGPPLDARDRVPVAVVSRGESLRPHGHGVAVDGVGVTQIEVRDRLLGRLRRRRRGAHHGCEGNAGDRCQGGEPLRRASTGSGVGPIQVCACALCAETEARGARSATDEALGAPVHQADRFLQGQAVSLVPAGTDPPRPPHRRPAHSGQRRAGLRQAVLSPADRVRRNSGWPLAFLPAVPFPVAVHVVVGSRALVF